MHAASPPPIDPVVTVSQIVAQDSLRRQVEVLSQYGSYITAVSVIGCLGYVAPALAYVQGMHWAFQAIAVPGTVLTSAAVLFLATYFFALQNAGKYTSIKDFIDKERRLVSWSIISALAIAALTTKLLPSFEDPWLDLVKNILALLILTVTNTILHFFPVSMLLISPLLGAPLRFTERVLSYLYRNATCQQDRSWHKPEILMSKAFQFQETANGRTKRRRLLRLTRNKEIILAKTPNEIPDSSDSSRYLQQVIDKHPAADPTPGYSTTLKIADKVGASGLWVGTAAFELGVLVVLLSLHVSLGWSLFASILPTLVFTELTVEFGGNALRDALEYATQLPWKPHPLPCLARKNLGAFTLYSAASLAFAVCSYAAAAEANKTELKSWTDEHMGAWAYTLMHACAKIFIPVLSFDVLLKVFFLFAANKGIENADPEVMFDQRVNLAQMMLAGKPEEEFAAVTDETDDPAASGDDEVYGGCCAPPYTA